MCGRARATLSAERVAAASGTSEWVHREAYVPRYNAQPGAALPCVRASDPTRGEPPDERRVESMTWGLVPSFTGPGEKPDHFRMFNARGETLREKPAFGRLLRRRRCVALIDGFYEWRREGAGRAGAKQPYYLYLRGSRDENESASCERTHDAREVSETAVTADAETNVSRRWDDATEKRFTDSRRGAVRRLAKKKSAGKRRRRRTRATLFSTPTPTRRR
jgi:putative SOS response-associated peptidase YedK